MQLTTVTHYQVRMTLRVVKVTGSKIKITYNIFGKCTFPAESHTDLRTAPSFTYFYVTCVLCVQFYADLYHLTTPAVSQTSVERISATHKNFIDAVHQLLCAVRLITYA